MATPKSSSSDRINPDLLVGSKMRKHHQQSLREHVSAPTSDFARKQLEKMGWSEGTGLGKKRDGMKTHIRVKRRADQLGLGGSDKPEVVALMGDSEWWKHSVGSTLARLGKNKKNSKDKDKKKSSKDKDKKESKKIYTDEELFQATGGSRFGMRAGITNNLHKWARTEKDSAVGDSDNNKTSDSSDAAQRKRKADKLVASSDSSENDKKQQTSDDTAEMEAKQKKREKKEKKKKRQRREEEQPTEDSSTAKASTGSDKEARKADRKEKKKSKKSKKEKS